MTLIERLEAGETGRELDALAYVATRRKYVPNDRVKSLTYTAVIDNYRKDWVLHDGQRGDATYAPPALTTSVDAVKALQEEVLPGWYWMLDGSLAPERYEASLTDASVPSDAVREDVSRFFSHAPDECNARLAALLRAYGEEGV